MNRPTVASKGFVDLVLRATPASALSIMGTMVGASICLVAIIQLGGLQKPLDRVIEAHVVRIEAAAKGAENSASLIAGIAAGMTALTVAQETERNAVQGRMEALDLRLSRLEKSYANSRSRK